MTPGQDDARSTKFEFYAGSVKYTPVSISGIKSDREKVDRPDRTVRMTDQNITGEFTMVFKARDVLQILALKAWRSTRSHVDCTLIVFTEDGVTPRSTINIKQVCPKTWEMSDLSTDEAAKEVIETWTFVTDDINRLA